MNPNPMPAGPFDVVLADPPWPYDNRVSRAAAENHYCTMTLQELAEIGPDVWERCAGNASLFMWATGPFLPEAVTLIARWGFRFVTVAFVWVKVTRTVASAPTGPLTRELVVMPARDGDPGGPRHTRYGPGNYTRPGSEFVLLGVRGKASVPSSDVPQVLFAPVLEHSQKPDEVHRRIERLYPRARRIELFARRPMARWSTWGDDICIQAGP